MHNRTLLIVPVVVVAAAVAWLVMHAPGWFLAGGVAALVAVIATAAVRFAMLPAEARRYWLAARWHKLTWHRLARNLQLAYVDHHLGGIDSNRRKRVNYPRAHFRPDPFGFGVNLRLVPGVSRAEVERVGEHLANAWGAWRVGITQPGPNRLRLRAVRRDPLAEPLSADVLPPFDGRHVTLGRDEWSDMRRAGLANLSGSAFSGSPGRGKTEAALSLAVQLIPSPLVDTWILDGGACDWSPFADGVAGYVGDDLEAAEDMLRVLDAKMCDRRRSLQADRGVRNGWVLGPAEDYRLQWILVEEAPFYLDELAVKGDRKREGHVRACRGLLAGLLRRGRAPLFHTTMVAQKGTGTAGLPPDLRDLCGLRWTFGVATIEAAAAILGDDIRKHETVSPTLLQGPEHVGVASVLLRTGLSPYTLVRFPAIGDVLADAVARQIAPEPKLEVAPKLELVSSAPVPA